MQQHQPSLFDLPVSNDKYIVFKRDELSDLLDEDIWTYKRLLAHELSDAVVIRRQDKFASPCLATYASCIAMVAAELPEGKKKYDLIRIADYFEEQAKLAADEGYKLPD